MIYYQQNLSEIENVIYCKTNRPFANEARLLTGSRRPLKVLTENQLFIRYSGLCADTKAKITDEFAHTMRLILAHEHGPCPVGFVCEVEEIKVYCGAVTRRAVSQPQAVKPTAKTAATRVPRLPPTRRPAAVVAAATTFSRQKRAAGLLTTTVPSVEPVATVTLRFVLGARLTGVDESGVSEADHRRLLNVVDDIYYNVSDAVDQNRFRLTAVNAGSTGGGGGDVSGGGSIVEVASLREIGRRFEAIFCRDGEVREERETTAVCCEFLFSFEILPILLNVFRLVVLLYHQPLNG